MGVLTGDGPCPLLHGPGEGVEALIFVYTLFPRNLVDDLEEDDLEDEVERPCFESGPNFEYAISSEIGTIPFFLKKRRGGGASSPVDALEREKPVEPLDGVVEGDFDFIEEGGRPLFAPIVPDGLRAKNLSKGMVAPSRKFGELVVRARYAFGLVLVVSEDCIL